MNAATTGAVVGSMVAMQAAQDERIEKQRCEFVIQGFDSQKGSTKEMKDYSSCVQKLYPEPMNHTESVVAKGCVLVLLVAFVVGAIYGYRQQFGDLLTACLWAILMPVCVAVAGVVLCVLIAGIGFLFS